MFKYCEAGPKKEFSFQPNIVEIVLTRIDRAYVVNNNNIITHELIASGCLHTWNN